MKDFHVVDSGNKEIMTDDEHNDFAVTGFLLRYVCHDEMNELQSDAAYMFAQVLQDVSKKCQFECEQLEIVTAFSQLGSFVEVS